MRLFYQAKDVIEAQLLADRLRAQHVEATVLRASLVGNCVLSPINFPEVWLNRDSDLIRAKAVLEQMQAEQQAMLENDSPDWTCASCGESVEASFATCWNCGAENDG